MFNFFHRPVVLTHNGTFHPDDVFAVATLEMVIGKIKLYRTRDPRLIGRADYVVDVGGIYDPKLRRFDHHQRGGAGNRPNGVPYASFGLVWREFGSSVAGSKSAADIVEEMLVQYIDAFDNGYGELKPVAADVYPFTFGEFIMEMNPSYSSPDRVFKAAFLEALPVAKVLLKNLVYHAKERLAAEQIIGASYAAAKDKRVLMFDKQYAWPEVVNKFPEPLYVIEPASAGKGWKVTCVRSHPHSFSNRKDLPIEWAGKRDGDLADITGVPDAIFCHNQRFVAYAKSKAGALALAKLALQEGN